MHRNLQDFLAHLDTSGELLRVREAVSSLLEIAEVANRHSKSSCPTTSPAAQASDPHHCDLGGRALLFENVKGCDFPLAINVFGSYRRAEMALGCDGANGFQSIADRIAVLTKPEPPAGFANLVAKLRQFLPLLRVPPKRVRSGICQEVVRLTTEDQVDLTRLPLIKCWPLDGDPTSVGFDMTPEQAGTAKGQGRYITFAGMHTIHADDRDAKRPASHNIGMYRAQLIDETHLAMHWHMHHDGAAHWRSWKRLGQPMPIAICFGGESVLPYAATSPLPPGISELLMAGFLNSRGIRMVRGRTVPLCVPANSEIVIEGFVSTDCGGIGWEPGTDEPLGPGAVFEGPFGDHTGFYSLPDRYPIVTVTAITHRRAAVFPATIVGIPPQEDYYLGKATERIFLPLLRTMVPDVVDYHLPLFGCFHNCAFVRINKAYPLQARRVMHAIWGAGQMAWTKMIVVVDEDVDVHDEQEVLRTLFERCHFGRDIELVTGPLDILDHAAAELGAGGKIGFDATRKVTGESAAGIQWDEPGAGGSGAVAPGADSGAAWPDFGEGQCAVIGVATGRDGVHEIEQFAASPERARVRMVIAIDQSVAIQDWEQVLFHLCANVDPARDMVLLDDPSPGDRRFAARLGFDATPKQAGPGSNGRPVRRFPPILDMDKATRQHVDERAGIFGL